MKSTVDDVDARLDKARTRNRAAQLRLRQRLQAELDGAHGRVHDVQQQLAAARERYVLLQRQRVGHSTRCADAAVALAAAQTEKPAAAAAGGAAAAGPVHASGLPTSLNFNRCTASSFEQEPRKGGASDAQHARGPTPALGSGGAATSSSHAARDPSGVLTWSAKHRTPFTLRQPRPQPPRPISDFSYAAAILYGDLRTAADPGARLVDFSRHSLRELVATVVAEKTAALGAEEAQQRGDVCWFVQTLYEVTEGTPLSASATLSSPECVASFALHYLMTRLEFMLIAAATPRTGGTVRTDITELYRGGELEADQGSDGSAASDGAPPAKAHRLPDPPSATPFERQDGGEDSSGEAVTGADAPRGCAPMHGSAQHARRAPSAEAAPSGLPVCRDSVTSSNTAHSMPGAGRPPWSRRVRCGVNATHDAAAAVRAVVHSVIRSCCRDIPAATLQRLLYLFHAGLLRMLTSYSAADRTGRGPVAADIHGFQAGVRAASCGIVALLVEAVDAMACMHALRQLQADCRRGTPGEEGGETIEARLEAQAHGSIACYALLHYFTLRDAPRTVRSLAQHGVYPLARFEEADGLHIHLYRGLRLTDADRSRLAEHWQMWSQISTSLNRPFHSALSTLRSLPGAADVPAALVARVDAVAAGAAELDRDVGTGRGMHMHVQPAGDGSGAAEPGTDRAREGPWVEAPWLLGCCAEATMAAEVGVNGLAAAHDMHGRVRHQMTEHQLQPGLVLGALQLVRVWSAHIPSGTAPSDFMKLAQLAAAQQRWRDMASRPAVLQMPLPKYQWPEGIGAATGDAERDCQAVGVR